MSCTRLKARTAENSPRMKRPPPATGKKAASFANNQFVSIDGSSYARFRRALAPGNLTLVRAAAAELPSINLDDALRVCLLLRTADAALYERAVVRWLGRFALEHQGATLAMLHQAVAAFERLPDNPEAAQRELVALIRR